MEEMHLEDTIEFCAKVKRESEQTSALKTQGKTRKGVFTAPSVNSLKGNLGSVYKEKLMRIFQWILCPPNNISSGTTLLLQMTLTKE